MSEWTAAQVKEFVNSAICAERRHRDALRLEDKQAVKNEFVSLDKALKLQQASYPTTRDFNELKSHVDTVLAVFKTVSVAMVLAGIIFAILTYFK